MKSEPNMPKVTTELDFFGLEKKQTNNAPNKPKFKKLLDRRRSFRGSAVVLSFLFLFSSLTFFLCGPKRSLSGDIFHAEIQGAISKMDPEIIKSLLATGANPSETSTRSLSVPSTPKEDHQRILISPVHAPLTRFFFFVKYYFIFCHLGQQEAN